MIPDFTAQYFGGNENCVNAKFEIVLTLFYMGGGSNRPPLADYCTLILGGCPEWTDFS